MWEIFEIFFLNKGMQLLCKGLLCTMSVRRALQGAGLFVTDLALLPRVQSPLLMLKLFSLFKITGLLIVLKFSVIFEIKCLYHSLFLSDRYLFLTSSWSHFILLPLQNRLCCYIQDTLNLSHRNNFCLLLEV